jgi:hypothetical protein
MDKNWRESLKEGIDCQCRGRNSKRIEQEGCKELRAKQRPERTETGVNRKVSRRKY